MAADTCTNCGLPDELCVCEDMDISESPEVTVRVEEAGFADKKMTVVSGVLEKHIDGLESKLKSALGAGGTRKNNEIHIQGDQTGRDKLVDILENDDDFGGYEVVFK